MKRTWILGLLVLAWLGRSAVRSPSCGGEDAVACPEASLVNGLGTTVERREACRDAGYLCAGGAGFQVRRWPLAKGRLRVRVPPPPLEDREARRRLHAAAVAGILQWDGHPFPLQVDDGRVPVRVWDVELYWVPRVGFGPGGSASRAGVTQVTWRETSEGPDFRVGSISTVLYEGVGGGREVPASELLVAHVAAHEMGHALGILRHSDRATDVMAASVAGTPPVSSRDRRTVAALYRLPNGARVPGS